MNEKYDFPDPQHIYGYCAIPTALVNEQIEAGQNFQYYITVIHTDGCEPPMDNCVLITTYEFCLDELVAFIRQTDNSAITIIRIDSLGKGDENG